MILRDSEIYLYGPIPLDLTDAVSAMMISMYASVLKRRK